MSEDAPRPHNLDPPDDWRSMHLWQFQPVRDVLVVLTVICLFWLGYALRTVTVPMLLALLLAYLVEPVVRWLTARYEWVSRPVAAGGLIIALGLAVIAPVSLGVVFGVGQAVGAVDRFAMNVDELRQSIDQPDNERLRSALPSDGWRSLRDYLVGLEAIPSDGAGETPDSGAGEQQDGQPQEPSTSNGLPPDDTGVADDPQETDAAEIVLTTSQRLGQRLVRSVGAWLDENRSRIGADIGSGALEVGSWLLRLLASLVGTLLALGFGAFLVMFFFFFFSSGLGGVKRFFERLVPKQHRKTVFTLAGQMDAVIAAFIRGRLTIMAIMSALFVVAYWFIGVPAPLLVGIGVGVLSAVPYLSLIGVPISIVLMALEPGTGFQATWWWIIGAPIGVYMLVQATDDYVWTPLIQGKATDMDTPTILFAVLAGGVLFGIYGVLIAIPVAACVKIMIREVVWPNVVEWVEGREKDPLPLDRK
ncbi:MAG: hypothetical protein Tsb0013_10160 [Phycisphaerales bacterium]